MGCINECQREQSFNKPFQGNNNMVSKYYGIPIIDEQESYLEKSFLKSVTQTSTGFDMSQKYDEFFDSYSQTSQNNIPIQFGTCIQIFNLSAQRFLHSNCVKHKDIKKAYNTQFNSTLSEYGDWNIIVEEVNSQGELKNKDIIKISHQLTGHLLAAFQTPIEQDLFTVATIPEKRIQQPLDYWKIELVNQEQSLKVGSIVRIVHVQTQLYLSYMIRKQRLLTLSYTPDNQTMWRIDQQL